METDKLLSRRTGSGSESERHVGYESISEPANTSGPPASEGGMQRAANNSGMTSAQKKLLASLLIVRMLNGSLIAVMIPFFPVEAASRGVSQTVISSLFSVFAVAKMIMSPFIGRLAPVVGITRLYNFGIAAAGVSTVIFGTLNYIADTSTFVAACFLVRLVEAAGSAAIAVCGYTIAGSQFPGKVNRVVALLGSALTIGLALTPAIWGGLFALGGFGTPFYTLGAIMLLMAAVNQRLMPTMEKITSGPQTSFFKNFRVFIGSTGNWICMATVLIFSADVSTVSSAIAPYANDVLGVSPSTLGLYYLVSTTMYAIINFLWGWLAEGMRNRYKMMSPCLLVASFGILLVAPSPLLGLEPAWWITGLGMTIEDMFIGGALTPCFKLMLDCSVQNGLEFGFGTQSFVAGVYQMMFSMGIAIGPISGGIIVDAYGFPWMTTVLAFATASVGLLIGIKAISTMLDHKCDRTTNS
ncbi:MFS-type transporter SLC18B1-like [Pollicipes pollicipes]|uniref:MFS-type transporter SLC18B1-like n=1 Tax=Pollicipes pollicipes TaxID=41117 RepID=UPI001884A78F|nr:MFS-type transporter SLC18B1-like [Pollicipes pollicipes]